MVLPTRAARAAGWSEEALAELVSGDSLIGMTPRGAERPSGFHRRSPFGERKPASAGTAFADDRPSLPMSAVRIRVGDLVDRDEIAVEEQVVGVDLNAGTRLDHIKAHAGRRSLKWHLHRVLGLALAHRHGLRPLGRDTDAGHDDIPDRAGAR